MAFTRQHRRELALRMQSDDPAERAEAREQQALEHLRDIRSYLLFFVVITVLGGLVTFWAATSSTGGY